MLMHTLGNLETFKKSILNFPIFKNIIFDRFHFWLICHTFYVIYKIIYTFYIYHIIYTYIYIHILKIRLIYILHIMSPGKDETCVCGYIRSEFIHWPLWRTLMRTKYFLFVHHTTSILAKLSTWCFEHSGDISCSLLVNLSHTDESWEGRNPCLWIYKSYIY